MNTKSTKVRNIELLIAYYHHPSVKLRNQLVELNSGLVRQVAHQMSYKCNEPYEDLEQIGYLGLIRAIERFNPAQGCAFSSFAIPFIRGELLHYLRDKASLMKMPRRWQDLYSKAQKVYKGLTETLGREPLDTEIAQTLGVSSYEWNQCQLAIQNRLPLSLDCTVSQNKDSYLSFSDTLPDPYSQKLQQLQEDRLHLQTAMGKLEEKTKTVIDYVFLRDLSRQEAAKQMGISVITLSRRLHRGIEELGLIVNNE